MPILGTIASSTRQGQSTDSGAMYPLQVITLGGSGASSVTFTNIPSTYKHLEIRFIATNNDTANSGLGNVRCSGFFNGDTTATNYYNHWLDGNGASASSSNENSAKWIGSATRNSMVAPGVTIAQILDYASTSKKKTTRALWGWENNGNNSNVRFVSGVWSNTAAITSISIVPESGSFKEYSQFALYGIKGA